MLEINQAKQLKELQRENARLNRMLADEVLGKELLKEVLEKSCKPGHKRQMAEKLASGDRCTARAARRHFGLHRSTYAYRAKEADAWEAKMKGALRRKSDEHPELGYAKITRLLKQEGWQVGARNVQRLRRELGLAVPATISASLCTPTNGPVTPRLPGRPGNASQSRSRSAAGREAAPSASRVVGGENVQPFTEWQRPPVTYWAPVTNGVVAKLTYRFDFPKPTREVYLQAQCEAWDFEMEPGSDEKVKGAFAMVASVDGTNWVDLFNRLEPEPMWGGLSSETHSIDYQSRLPAELTGARQLWVQVRMLCEGVPVDPGFYPVQHSRIEDSSANSAANEEFIVRARY